MKYKVVYTVQYETEIECESNELDGCICDINIPEDDKSKYIGDTYETISVTDADTNDEDDEE